MALTLVRMRGAHGPILRCQGDLTIDTMEALRRDLALLGDPGRLVLVINLNGVRRLDADGASVLAEIAAGAAARGRLVLVCASDALAGELHALGVAQETAICRSEAEAAVLLGVAA